MCTICTDLRAEQEELDAVLSKLDETAWNHPTPSPGWLVRDQISHLGSTDRVATTAATDPDRFIVDITTSDRRQRMQKQLDRGHSMSGVELLHWWRSGCATMLEALQRLDPQARIPWFGPAMSAVSFATARLMETWAHGQDIIDALGLQRAGTARLRHVAHIGVQARPFSYRAHQQEPPTDPVRVELVSPAGTLWTWSDEQASNRVSGTALDFCLVVTQRRHLADTALQLQGPVAQAWMRIAQAFAGPPGVGRQPGQFSTRP